MSRTRWGGVAVEVATAGRPRAVYNYLGATARGLASPGLGKGAGRLMASGHGWPANMGSCHGEGGDSFPTLTHHPSPIPRLILTVMFVLGRA